VENILHNVIEQIALKNYWSSLAEDFSNFIKIEKKLHTGQPFDFFQVLLNH